MHLNWDPAKGPCSDALNTGPQEQSSFESQSYMLTHSSPIAFLSAPIKNFMALKTVKTLDCEIIGHCG